MELLVQTHGQNLQICNKKEGSTLTQIARYGKEIEIGPKDGRRMTLDQQGIKLYGSEDSAMPTAELVQSAETTESKLKADMSDMHIIQFVSSSSDDNEAIAIMGTENGHLSIKKIKRR